MPVVQVSVVITLASVVSSSRIRTFVYAGLADVAVVAADAAVHVEVAERGGGGGVAGDLERAGGRGGEEVAGGEGRHRHAGGLRRRERHRFEAQHRVEAAIVAVVAGALGGDLVAVPVGVELAGGELGGARRPSADQRYTVKYQAPLGRFQMSRVSSRAPPTTNSFQTLVPGGNIHSFMSVVSIFVPGGR